MASLFLQGGWFMVPLTVLLLIIIAIAVYRTVQILKNEVPHETTFRHQLAKIKSVGLFAFILGILGQLAGLYQVFATLSVAQSIPTAILANGVKMTIIPFIYGTILFLLSYLIWFGLDSWVNNKTTA